MKPEIEKIARAIAGEHTGRDNITWSVAFSRKQPRNTIKIESGEWVLFVDTKGGKVYIAASPL